MRVASAHMADAIREITVERGLDPRDGALMAFGGAGGLFATLLARESEIPTIVIPPFTGNFSAWGLLGADLTQTAARTMIAPLSDESAGEAGSVLGSCLKELRSGRAAGENGASAGGGPRPPISRARSTASRSRSRRRGGDQRRRRRDRAPRSRPSTRRSSAIACRSGSRSSRCGERFAPRCGSESGRPRRGRATERLAPAMRVYSFTRRRVGAVHAARPRARWRSAPVLAGPALIAEETAMTYLDSGFSGQGRPDRIPPDRARGGSE